MRNEDMEKEINKPLKCPHHHVRMVAQDDMYYYYKCLECEGLIHRDIMDVLDEESAERRSENDEDEDYYDELI